ncbi:MAG: hypothetical protein ACKOFA_02175 [Rhodoluna sp.]
MLSLTAIFLLGGLYQSASCPGSFQTASYSVAAISNSSDLLLCISKAVLVTGSDGKLNLVLNSSSPAPSCLIYPNGLSPDLSAQLISSGHTGCWSLYPPTQIIAVTNIGNPSRASISKALATFKPTQPRIILYPKTGHTVGQQLSLWPSSKIELLRSKMLSLPCEIRFTPKSYRWSIAGKVASQAKQQLLLASAGQVFITLSVGFAVEYRFVNLTSWRSVRPNLTANAPPVTVVVSSDEKPKLRRVPRLVDKPCTTARRYGC